MTSSASLLNILSIVVQPQCEPAHTEYSDTIPTILLYCMCIVLVPVDGPDQPSCLSIREIHSMLVCNLKKPLPLVHLLPYAPKTPTC